MKSTLNLLDLSLKCTCFFMRFKSLIIYYHIVFLMMTFFLGGALLSDILF